MKPGEWFPLTNAQQLIWASQQIYRESPLYTMAFLYDIPGKISVGHFRAAFDALIDQCDALRTVVDSVSGVPAQRVLESVSFDVPFIDVSGHDDPAGAAQAWAEARCRLPFAIEERTFDAALLRLGEEHFAWYLSQHHIVTDALSFVVLFERMEVLYRAAHEGRSGPTEPTPPFSTYREFEAAARDSAVDASAERAAAGAVHVPQLYGRRPAGVSTGNERLSYELSRDHSERLRALAARPDVRALTPDLSLFHLFATALFAYLYRVSGQSRISIGAPAHNRVSAEFKQTAGLFVEVYPLQVEIDDEESFASLHAKVKAATSAFIREAKPGSSNPLVNREINSVLNFIRGGFESFAGIPVRADWLHPGQVEAEHHLRLQVHDFSATDRFTLLFDCNTDVLSDDYRAAVPDHFVRLLQALEEDWEQRIDAVALQSTAAEAAAVAAVNGDVPAGPVPPGVVARFRDQVAAHPDAPALHGGDRQWSYAAVDEITSRIARRLQQGSMVGVCLGRSPEAVFTMLGALKAGAAYVPIDPDWPGSRIEYVIADSACTTVVSESPLSGVSSPITFEELLSTGPIQDAERSPEADDPAYILYTSGSTGRPKGVIIDHGSLANYVGWAGGFYDAGRRLTFPLFTPLTFDLTVTSIFVPLTSGGSIRIYPEADGPADLAVQQVFDDDAVDIVKLTPSHLALLPDRDLSTSRIGQLILGGEDLTTATARRAHDRFGGRVLIHNEYGPTEATVGCVVHTYNPAADEGLSVPIGRPITNMRAYVLDAGGHPVPFGVPGELWVAGSGVARGYAGRPELTAERFVANDTVGESRLYRTGDLARVRPDGTVEYLGRRDDQVKVRGARVELGEVEAALAAHPDVGAAAARVWERVTGLPTEDLVFCARCGLASNYPGVSFDADRVCNQCRSFESYNEKARVYFKPMDELEAILKGSTGAEYDCLSLLSGGKDSTYALGRLVDMGLRVLAFTLDNGYISDEAKENIRRVVAELGVDHVFATTPAMNEIFVDSLQRHANVCQGCFKTIYTLSLQTARERGIPYIVTGLSRGQFFETRLTEDLFTELTVSSDQIDANVIEARKAYHQVDDAVRRRLDVSIFDDDRIFDEVQFVDFYRYCDVSLDEMFAYLDERVPWVRPSDTGRSTNCRINDVGIYFHKKTQGFHNYALPYSWDVRLGHKTRDEALEELDDDIDVAAVQEMLSEIGYPEDVTEFESGRRLVAYYTSSGEIPASELRSFLSSALPDQMVPSQFVHLEGIPLTQNGKVDRAALPEPGTSRPLVDTVFLAPRTDTERTLADIWEAVIGIDSVGARDNFFDLGGDSIMAIQIVARAHRLGLPVTLRQLFDAPTVEHLAQEAERSRLSASERMVGPVGLTPIQQWFFEQEGDRSHLHQVVQVRVPDDVDPVVLAECFRDLAGHHDAIRQSFTANADGWASSAAEEGVAPALTIVESVDPRTRAEAEERLLDAFDLSQAPLMRAGLFREADESARLMLVAHHLIIDVVSWSTLLDDLVHLYHQRLAGEPVGLPAVTTSVADWVAYLERHAASLDPTVWTEIAGRTDIAGTVSPTEGGAGAVTVERRLSAQRTGELVNGSFDSHIGIDELLIAALAMTLAESAGHPTQRLFLEGHGRESDEAALDVTRTLGWFASLYPAILEVADPSRPGAVARRVRDQLRRVSSIGSQYGILRYLHPDSGVRDALTLDDRDHVVFNYLGRISADDVAADFTLIGPVELSRPAGALPPFGDDVSAVITGSELALTWTSTRRDAAEIGHGIDRLFEHLGSLLDAADGEPDAGEFPLAGLDADGLDKLAAALRTGDGNRQ